MSSEYNQDIICDRHLKQKTDGFFVDIGACYHETWNNSFFFEKMRNYRGLAIELDPKYEQGWISNRPNSKLVVGDATTQDYQKLLDDLNAPETIDFLSVDIDPREKTLAALYKIFTTTYKFSTIAFEVDAGYGTEGKSWTEVRDQSREFLLSRDYVLVDQTFTNGFHVDDIWVHKSIYDPSI